ncbi:MAG: Na+/H+ antiporter NhaA [Gemmatimonadetes bacterium]|nr:Na+/H+ antiporter NhaA [Gemmatimonadota bacterium]
MRIRWDQLTSTFVRFVESERASGGLLLLCSILGLLAANSAWGPQYAHLWEREMLGLRLEQWINDGLMAVFFLLIGLELERELYSGELSDPRRAALPAIAALGGMVVPALIHFGLNAATPTQPGAGIPMATDIAFALGVLALLGKRVPASLKVFLVAFAVMDDLGAVLVIAGFYTVDIVPSYLVAAIAVLGILVVANRRVRIMALPFYLIGGALMWWLLLRSGVHPTLAGVALAFAIPYSARDHDTASPSHRLEHVLQRPVAYLIVPTFALANTGVLLGTELLAEVGNVNGLGIGLGLIAGKPIGVAVATLGAVATGRLALPRDLRWSHIVGAGLLGGIGFTMSIFIANLAFPASPLLAGASKVSILLSSVIAGTLGYLWLRFVAPSPLAPSPLRA